MAASFKPRNYQSIKGIRKARGSWGTNAGNFYGPTSVAIEKVTQNIFITEAYNGRVQVFSPDLGCLNEFQTKCFGNRSCPWGICIMRSMVFVLHLDKPFFNFSQLALLSIFNLDGTLVTCCEFPNSDCKLNLSQPRGIDMDQDDSLYICDKGNDRVRILTTSLPCVKDFVKVSGPLDIKCHEGTAVVLAGSPGVIKVFSSEGVSIREYTDQIIMSVSNYGFLAIDKAGTILVSVEFKNKDRILILNSKLEYVHSIIGHFENIRGLAVDENSRIINVCEKNNYRLKIF